MAEPRFKSPVQTSRISVLKKLARNLLVLSITFLMTACVYEVDVQQGNKLEPQDIEAVETGMTRSQVRYLLGTPVVNNLFDNDRWDYVYYFKKGRSRNPERRWIVIWFEGDTVSEIERDLIEPPKRKAT